MLNRSEQIEPNISFPEGFIEILAIFYSMEHTNALINWSLLNREHPLYVSSSVICILHFHTTLNSAIILFVIHAFRKIKLKQFSNSPMDRINSSLLHSYSFRKLNNAGGDTTNEKLSTLLMLFRSIPAVLQLSDNIFKKELYGHSSYRNM